MIREKRLMKEITRIFTETVEYNSLYSLGDERITNEMVELQVITLLCTINTVLPAIMFKKNRLKMFKMRSDLHTMLLELDVQEI